MIVEANTRGPEEQRSAEGRARIVVAHLDELANALRRAQLAEDDEVRHEEILAAHTELVRAEAAF